MENYATENAQIVYFYFDYKAQTIQTGVYVVGTLLKQLLCQSNHIPADLESFYNNSIANHKKPSLENLMRFVGPLSRPRVYAVFDALDECSDAYQRDVFSLFAHLEKSGVRLLISSRPHVRITRGQLESVKNLVVSADESDLENFVLRTLKTKRNNNPELEKKCLQLAKGAEGM